MLFQIQLLASFLIGGVFVALQTLIAERLQGTWRAVALTIPITLAMGLFFVGLVTTTTDVVEAARIVPAALSSDYIFVLVFALLCPFGLFISLVGGFAAWALVSFFILIYPPATFATSIFLYGLPAIFTCYFLVKKLPQKNQLKVFPMNAKHIFLRSLIGGSIIVIVIFLSKTLGTTWGGLFSAFPATFASTFIIYYQLQGKGSIPTVARSVFFPGSLGFIVYAWAAAVSFPTNGIWVGTLLSYLATFLFFGIYYLIQKRILRF